MKNKYKEKPGKIKKMTMPDFEFMSKTMRKDIQKLRKRAMLIEMKKLGVSKRIAQRIVQEHLEEDPYYYD